MKASVIVALNPHQNDLGRLLDAHARQCFDPTDFEVLVVNTGNRTEIAAGFERHRARRPDTPIRLIDCDGTGRAAANNGGVAAARGALIVLSADDFVPSPMLVAAHVGWHALAGHRDAIGIGPGLFLATLRRDPFRRWLEDSGTLYGVKFNAACLHWRDDFFFAGNASLPRALFDRAGGFDERFPYDLSDDLEFGIRVHRLGARSTYVPKAVSWHDHAVELAERGVAMRRSGEAAHLIEALHGDVRPWATLVAQAPETLARQAEAAAESHRMTGSWQALTEYFRATLDRCFVEGYRAASRHSEVTSARRAACSGSSVSETRG